MYDLKSILLDHLPMRIFWKDRESTYLGCNASFAKDVGLDRATELHGKTDFDLPWADTKAELYRADDSEVMRTGKAKLNYEEARVGKTGKIWVSTSKIPLFDDNRNVVGVMGTYEDITVRKEAEFELIKLRQQAEAANRAKTEFLCRMSHDLRTPLNAILGNAQILHMSPELTRDQEDCLQQIEQSGDDLHHLVSGILEMSQIESGGTELQIESCHLMELLQRVLQQYVPTAKAKGLSLRLETDLGLPSSIETDPMKFRRIVGNLVGNAIKFTARGEVKVTVRLEDTFLRIDVKDTGIGMAEEALTKIFSPFSQVNGTTSKRDGVGLGLAICERFVSILGGRISVESEFGIGSRFQVWLPVSKIELGPQTALAPKVKEAPVTGIAGKRILIVDDHPPNRQFLHRFLTKMGVEIMEAANGVEALERSQQFKPEVILMDIRMPIMDGLEATRLLRETTADDRPAIIAVSGEAFEEIQASAIEAGCDHYITKPVCLKSLVSSIERLAC